MLQEAVMQTTARKIGNSTGAIFPASILKEYGIKAGTPLEITPTSDGFNVKPSKRRPKYKLADLIAKCDENAPMPQELTDWDNATAVGNEKW